MLRDPWSRGVPRKFLVLLLAAAGGGIYWWQHRSRQDVPFANERPLDMAAYTSQPGSLRGNVFTVRGRIDQTLAAGSGSDRVVLVMTSGARGSDTKAEPIPLKVPGRLAGRMQSGREFVFKVTVGDASV